MVRIPVPSGRGERQKHYYDLQIWMTSSGRVGATFMAAGGSGNSNRNVYADTLEMVKEYRMETDRNGNQHYNLHDEGSQPGQLIQRNQNTWGRARNNPADRGKLQHKGRVNMPLLR